MPCSGESLDPLLEVGKGGTGFSLCSWAHVSRLESTLARNLISVDSKRLTEKLNPLEATLTKNQGEGGSHA
jgi:hypothetical protein